MPIVPSVAMKGSILPTVVISAVEQAATRADDEREHDRGRQHERGVSDHAGIHEEDHEAGDEGHHGADGKIEVARRDDEGGTHRDDRDEGATRRDIRQVVDADEVGVYQRPDDQQQRQRRKGRDSPEVDIPPAAAPALRFDRVFACRHVRPRREFVVLMPPGRWLRRRPSSSTLPNSA
jgi:hypothetical protein